MSGFFRLGRHILLEGVGRHLPPKAMALCVLVCLGVIAMRMRRVEEAALRLQHPEFRCCGSELNGFCMVKV